MGERVVEKGANFVVGKVTLGKLGVETNPRYAELEPGFEEEENSKIYSSTCLIIIDDENNEIVPRLKIVKR